MRCFDRKTTIPPRKWTRRGMLILLALFALMTHSIVRSGKASATGISPVAITIYGQGNYTSSGASRGTGGLTNPHAVALDGSAICMSPIRATIASSIFRQGVRQPPVSMGRTPALRMLQLIMEVSA